MEFDLRLQQFVDWRVYNVTPIKNKFGYRVVLMYADGTKMPQQKSGFPTKKVANADRDRTLGEHYKKLLEDNGLPNIRWHDLRSTFCTILLKNNFNPKAVSQLMRHAKEIIAIDVYGDNAEIIADCLDDLQSFIDDVVPKDGNENGTDFSEDDYIDKSVNFLHETKILA